MSGIVRLAAGLDESDRQRRVFGEPRGDDRAGGAGADDDDVEAGHAPSLALTPSGSAGAGRQAREDLPLHDGEVVAHGALRALRVARGDGVGDRRVLGVALADAVRAGAAAIAQADAAVPADLPQQRIDLGRQDVARAGGDGRVKGEVGGAGIGARPASSRRAGCAISRRTRRAAPRAGRAPAPAPSGAR